MKWFGWIKRLWPSSLVGQIILAILICLIVAQVISLYALGGVYRKQFYNASEGQMLHRMVVLTQLLEDAPPQDRLRILKVAGSGFTRFWLDTKPATRGDEHNNGYGFRLARRLENALGYEYKGNVKVNIEIDRDDWGDDHRHIRHRAMRQQTEGYGTQQYGESEWWHIEFWKPRPPAKVELDVAIRLPDGYWLNLKGRAPTIPSLFLRQAVVSMMITGLFLVLTLFFLVRRITRPLRNLTKAAELLGRGGIVDPLPEEGPADLKSTVRAFNDMNDRLQRFVADRTQMLAALSHDLRTPITTLRLRIELMEPSQDRDRLLATLEEMHQMAEASLTFARESASREDTVRVNLDALIDSICEDLVDIGMPVKYESLKPIVISCRQNSLKRALRNLIENGVKYGDEVDVSLRAEKGQTVISIKDKGPGIPEEEMKQVFEPFVRLEKSRNRTTGGIGLGLSIARTIIHAHGGEIKMTNLEQGLEVEVVLP